jgi:carbonic anhydrase
MPVSGTQQSPIKIETGQAKYTPFEKDFLQFHYSKALNGKIDDVKHNFVFDPPQLGEDPTPWSITVGGVTWLIRQIHLHEPAEHLVDTDTPNRFEVHLVHSAPKDPEAMGDKLVIGVFIDPREGAKDTPSLRALPDPRLSRHGLAHGGGPQPTKLNPHEFVQDCSPEQFIPL